MFFAKTLENFQLNWVSGAGSFFRVANKNSSEIQILFFWFLEKCKNNRKFSVELGQWSLNFPMVVRKFPGGYPAFHLVFLQKTHVWLAGGPAGQIIVLCKNNRKNTLNRVSAA